MCRAVLSAAWMVLLIAASLNATAGQGIAANGDEEALRKASAAGSAKDWLALLNSWCGDETELAKLEKCVADLGSDSFDERAAASETLLKLGPAAVPLLLGAMRTNDLETERRVHTCLKRINRQWKPEVRGSVVDRVIEMNTDEAFATLLLYLPWSGHDEVANDIVFHLYGRARDRPTLRASLRRALADPVSLRRAAAACIMARLGSDADRGIVRKLLGDSSPIVRLRAAQGLLAAKDSSAIPTLIELLLEPAVDISWQAEELLHWVATANPPVESVGAATRRQRQTCRNVWRLWWQHRHQTLDWRAIDADPRRPRLLLICTGPRYTQLNRQNGQRLSIGKSQIWLCGCDGFKRWSMPVYEVDAFQLLPGNCLFVHQECPARTPAEDGVASKHGDLVDLWGNLLSYPNSLAMDLVPYPKPLDFHRHMTLRDGNDLHLQRYRVQEISPDNRVLSETPIRDHAAGFCRCLPLVGLGFDHPRPKNLDLVADVERQRARLRSKDILFVRLAIADLQAQSSDKAALLAPDILEVIADPNTCDAEVMEGACSIFRWIGPSVIPLLKKGLKHPRAEVRVFVTPWLADSYRGDVKAITSLLTQLRADPHPMLRAAAVDTVVQSGLPESQVVASLASALGDPAPSVTITAATRLEALGSKAAKALPALLAAAKNKDWTVRVFCVAALGRVAGGDKRVVGFLLNSFAAPDAPSRQARLDFQRAAIRALAAARPVAPKVVAFLANSVEDHRIDTQVRSFVASSLGEIGPPARAAVPALRRACSDPNAEISKQARLALARIEH